MRRYIDIINETNYQNIMEFDEPKVFRVYHGNGSIDPFDTFDPARLNSRAGRAHGAFFFAASKATAMTYMETEETLKPQAQKKYNDLISQSKAELAKILLRLNKVLADHGEPPVEKYDRFGLFVLAASRRKVNSDDTLQRALDSITQMAEPYNWLWDQARTLQNSETNMVTSHYGTLYTCVLRVRRIWEKDMSDMAFEKDRWTDIFNTATQFDPDAVVLRNVVDTGCDFGSPDTIYAVFDPKNITIIDRKIFGDE